MKLFSLLLNACLALKCLVMNDIHLNVNSTDYIPMPGSETTISLLDIMLQDIKK